MKKWITVLALILCVTLLAVACKTTDDGEDSGTAPITVEATTAEQFSEAPTEEEPTEEILPGGMVVVTGDDGKFGPEITPDPKN